MRGAVLGFAPMRIAAAAALIAAAAAVVPARQAIPQATGSTVARDLRGAIDIHVHSDPDKVPRSLDAFEAVRFAKDKGMRAIVLRSEERRVGKECRSRRWRDSERKT